MDDLRDSFAQMGIDELIRIVTEESRDYEETALQFARDELKKRGVVIAPRLHDIAVEDKEEDEPIVKLHSPRDEIDLIFLKSVFDAEGLGYSVMADVFGSLRIGPQIPFFNEKTILVRQSDLERGRDLLMDYLEMTAVEGAAAKYSVEDKLRMIAEFLFFGWFIPGRPYIEMKDEQPE